MIRITRSGLREKLRLLDTQLKAIWLSAEPQDEDDVWDSFVTLLESRVELLRLCMDVKVELDEADYLPEWLERMAVRMRQRRETELGLSEDRAQMKKMTEIYNRLSQVHVEVE